MNRSHDIAAAALVELPRATPARLRSALRTYGGPEPVVEAIRAGSLDLPDGVLPGDLAERWRGTIDLALGRATAILSRRATRVFVLDGPRVTRRFREVEIELLEGDERTLRRLEKELRRGDTPTEHHQRRDRPHV